VTWRHNYQTRRFPLLRRHRRRLAGSSRSSHESQLDIIVQCGVHFIAETLRSSIRTDGAIPIPAPAARWPQHHRRDVRLLRAAVSRRVLSVAYVNTSADVKAEVDICLHLVERGGSGREPENCAYRIFLPTNSGEIRRLEPM